MENSKPKIDRQEFAGNVDMLRSVLKPTSCCIIDCFTEIYVWIGKTSPVQLRNIAREFGMAIPTKDERDPWAIVQIIHEG